MSAQILKFKLPKEKSALEKQAEIVKNKSNQQIFEEISEDVLGEWQHAASQNRLSEYIFGKLPKSVRGPAHDDYLNDLNVITRVENKLNMKLGLYFPSDKPDRIDLLGWQASFYYDSEIFFTPINLASEQIARSLNVVLYVIFVSTLKSLGR